MANGDTDLQGDNGTLDQDDSSSDTTAESEATADKDAQPSAAAANPGVRSPRSAGVTIKVGS